MIITHWSLMYYCKEFITFLMADSMTTRTETVRCMSAIHVVTVEPSLTTQYSLRYDKLKELGLLPPSSPLEMPRMGGHGGTNAHSTHTKGKWLKITRKGLLISAMSRVGKPKCGEDLHSHLPRPYQLYLFIFFLCLLY